ncbi:hypothetical protein A6M27_05970 [Acidithiobacillus thiooxidans]|uniref:Uncharacterized protein n=1 Tax=Acidithiobacillus thiooxidans TaxID=930 RepID=A0A1C2JAT7_ACITH|nr:hypothetical protein A6P07_04830 [Acidithiobacillus thiooxidans]OCX78186.1 hypothetical protein A6O24_05045 [Acidithiobacillus thiooxidans]OCX85342.1 hypothetical protein A6O26_01225 [Acidithiobacillus thiooxidans]OCX88766.1 hypothetical protein A6M27_05970 [Acidithiobacillus thiooxidans]OFC47661.1 hypothetical protein BAE47_08830 [Acidithiobacillus thiooxidans]
MVPLLTIGFFPSHLCLAVTSVHILVTAPHIDCPDAIAFLADHGDGLFLVFLQAADPVDEVLGVVGAEVFHVQDFQVLADHFVDLPPEMEDLAVGKDLQTPTDGWSDRKNYG